MHSMSYRRGQPIRWRSGTDTAPIAMPNGARLEGPDKPEPKCCMEQELERKSGNFLAASAIDKHWADYWTPPLRDPSRINNNSAILEGIGEQVRN